MDPIQEYEERKALRRSRFRWRLIAAIAVIAAIGLYLSQIATPVGKHIARFEVAGIITDDPDRDALLKKIAEKDDAEALIVRIDSPGGTVAGSEALYESLRAVGETKPVVAVMREVAASGGYITALAADHVVARGNTITGSVGVIFTAPNVHELLDRLGLEVVEVRSGRLKAQPAPYNPVNPLVIEAEEALVADSFAWFTNLVKERRQLDENAMEIVKEGGVFTGRQAQEIGLIDTLGGEETAVAWLEAEKNIAPDRKILDYEVRGKPDGLLDLILKQIGLAGANGPSLDTALAPKLQALYR